MDAFTALADPTRRTILEMLVVNGKMPASAIYKGFNSSAPAISQHLKVLKETGLVGVERKAQQRIYYVEPEPMRQLEKWIRQFSQRQEKQFKKLDSLLDTLKKDPAAPTLPFDED